MKIKKSDLAEKARKLQLTMPQIQLLLAQERFIARILNCDNGNKLVWKGGSLILRAYQKLEKPRYTVDIDLLAKGIPIPKVDNLFHTAMSIELDDDFEFITYTKTEMVRNTPYGGDRFEIQWKMNNKPGPQTLKIDVCAGDKVETLDEVFSNIALFSEEDLSVQIYPPEYILAEKLQTLSKLQTGSTRTKDIIDLWSLRLSVDKEKAFTAIQECYQNRGTEFNTKDILETLKDDVFSKYHRTQLSKKFSKHGLPDYLKICEDLESFLNILESP